MGICFPWIQQGHILLFGVIWPSIRVRLLSFRFWGRTEQLYCGIRISWSIGVRVWRILVRLVTQRGQWWAGQFVLLLVWFRCSCCLRTSGTRLRSFLLGAGVWWVWVFQVGSVSGRMFARVRMRTPKMLFCPTGLFYRLVVDFSVLLCSGRSQRLFWRFLGSSVVKSTPPNSSCIFLRIEPDCWTDPFWWTGRTARLVSACFIVKKQGAGPQAALKWP